MQSKLLYIRDRLHCPWPDDESHPGAWSSCREDKQIYELYDVKRDFAARIHLRIATRCFHYINLNVNLVNKDYILISISSIGGVLLIVLRRIIQSNLVYRNFLVARRFRWIGELSAILQQLVLLRKKHEKTNAPHYFPSVRGISWWAVQRTGNAEIFSCHGIMYVHCMRSSEWDHTQHDEGYNKRWRLQSEGIHPW